MFNRHNITRVAAVAVACAAFSTPLKAQEVRFAYHPYELQTVEGRQAVTARLTRIVRGTCDTRYALVNERSEVQKCIAELRSDIIAQIGNRALTAMTQDSKQEVAMLDR